MKCLHIFYRANKTNIPCLTNKSVAPLSEKKTLNYTCHYAICTTVVISSYLHGWPGVSGRSVRALVDMGATLTDISAVAPWCDKICSHTSSRERGLHKHVTCRPGREQRALSITDPSPSSSPFRNNCDTQGGVNQWTPNVLAGVGIVFTKLVSTLHAYSI